MYISSQVRLVLGGSASFQSAHVAEEIRVPLEGEGIGFGFSIGMERYTDDWKIWGLALTYSRDSLKSQQIEGLTVSETRGSVPIPGTPSRPKIGVTETQTELTSIGIVFSLAYD